MVAERQRSQPRDAEARIEFETRTRLVARFLKAAEAAQRRSELEMGH
jgi:hypothetical protein